MRVIKHLSFANRLLLANPGRLVVLVAGAVAVALAASGVMLAASTSLAVVQQTVDDGWRGAYDLLVRPVDAKTYEIGESRLVPANYLGTRTSGLTRGQWGEILAIPGVEVAAPVASLGWLKNDTAEVGLDLPGLGPGVYRVDVHVSIAGQSAVDQFGLFGLREGDGDSVLAGVRSLIITGDADGTPRVHATVGIVPSTWGLVVGVDPAQENLLIGLDQFTSEGELARGVHNVYDEAYQISVLGVPVLTAARSRVPGDITARFSRVSGLTADELGGQMEAALAADPPSDEDDYNAILGRIAAHGKNHVVFDAHQQLSSLLTPLRAQWVGITPAGTFSNDEHHAGSLNAGGRQMVLLQGQNTYHILESEPPTVGLTALGQFQNTVEPQFEKLRIGAEQLPGATFGGDEMTFRPLTATAPDPFKLLPVGTFDLEAISQRYSETINYVPLGVYADVPAKLLTDESGNSVNKTLPTSINPGGLNPMPPVGITNLEAVEALRGAQFIDAIRVRVGGISGYSAEAVRKIERVAQQIIDRTGLHVDVVAGSSPVDVSVKVPGVGTISERWTTLGAVPLIKSGAEGLSGVLLLAALLVVVIYLMTFGIFLTRDQAYELRLLQMMGWRKSSVIRLVAIQALLLGALAAGLAVVATIAIAASANLFVAPATLAVVFVSVLVAHPVVAGAAALVRSASAVDDLRGRAANPMATSGGASSLAAFAWTNASGARTQLLTVIAGISISVALAGLVAAVEIGANGDLRATIFGQFVALRVAPYHLLAAGAALFAAGAIAMDSALLAVDRRIATIGTLRAVGWRAAQVRRLITFEIAVPAMIAGSLAALAIGIGSWFLGIGPISLALIAIAWVISAAIGTVAAVPAASQAAAIVPATTMRAEGATAGLPGRGARQPLIATVALALIVVIAATGWSAAHARGLSAVALLPTPVPPSAAEQRLRTDVEKVASFADRTPESEAAAQALSYLKEELVDAGYGVENVPYLMNVLDIRDDAAQRVPVAGAHAVAVAYDPAAIDGDGVTGPIVALDASDGDVLGDCEPGILVIRIADEGAADVAAMREQACLGVSDAVVALTADDAAWEAIIGGASVHVPAGQQLIATPQEGPTGSTPWLIASIDSTGRGATQSGASVATILETARRLARAEVPVRIAIFSRANGGLASLIRILASSHLGPIVQLGPLGGPIATVLGTATAGDPDRESTRAALLGSVAVGGEANEWVERTSELRMSATSSNLLDALSATTGLSASDQGSVNLYALAIGLDAAYIGETGSPPAGITSLAGTDVDTPEVVDYGALERLAASLTQAIHALEGS